MDLKSSVATWLIQAIDPLTGEVLIDPTRGLLRPNDAQGHGAGFVVYTVEPDSTTARALPLLAGWDVSAPAVPG